MKVRARLSVLLLAGVATALALAGCGPSAPPADALQRGLGPDPETLDAQRARSVQAADVLRDLGEGLMGHAPDGELVPAAAESWTVSEDGRVYTFTLREGLAWSNGDALEAAHFMLGLRRLVDPKVAAFYAQSVGDIVNAKDVIAGSLEPAALGVSAPDARTLQIELERPVPYLLHLLTHPSTFPAFSYEGNASVTNGAYRLASREPGSLVSLERNRYYRNADQVAIARVDYHVTNEASAELNRYRAGELDITSNVPPDAFERVREEFPDELRVAPYLGVYYYAFNLARPPFSVNPALREALSMAIDREAIAGQVTGRGERPAWSWVPPGIADYDPPKLSYAALDQSERNALARRLYEEAGYGDDNPLTIELRYNVSDAQRRIAVAVQSMWREVLGVETILIAEEFRVLLQSIRERRETEVFRGSWIADYNDAQNFLMLLTSDNPSNLPGYENPEFDSLMERAASQTDPARRRLYLEEAERVLLADHAVIPLYFYVSKHLVSPRVRGWHDNVLDYHYSRHLSLDEAAR